MAKVCFTSALKRFFPNLEEKEIHGETVSEIITRLENHYPGIGDFLVDEQGVLRKHVNIFVDGELIQDRETLKDSIKANDEILLFQAISGG